MLCATSHTVGAVVSLTSGDSRRADQRTPGDPDESGLRIGEVQTYVAAVGHRMTKLMNSKEFCWFKVGKEISSQTSIEGPNPT